MAIVFTLLPMLLCRKRVGKFEVYEAIEVSAKCLLKKKIELLKRETLPGGMARMGICLIEIRLKVAEDIQVGSVILTECVLKLEGQHYCTNDQNSPGHGLNLLSI